MKALSFGASSTGERRLVRGRIRRVAAVVSAILAVTLAAEIPSGPAAAAPWSPPAPQKDTGVPRHDAVHTTRPTWTAGSREVHGTPAVTWPAAGTATSALAGTAVRTRAGTLPVWAASSSVRKVAVSVRDHATTARAGIAGLVLDVSRADGVRAAGTAQVTVDYSGFAQAYGGDWSSRLRLVRLADGRALPSHNDTKASTVTATVPVAATGGTAVALAAGPSGDNGTYAATSLSAAGTWQVTQQTGAFTWSQALRVPPSINGPVPTLSLAYSSLAVDGRTAGTNTQGSWIGDGWDMWPGFIERQFVSCADDKEAVSDATPNNTAVDGGDLCWRKPDGNATISLNGQAMELIKSSGDTWKGASDNGEKIELLTDTGFGNGDDNGEYWKVTKTDGTQMFFGRNHGVGGASAAAATDSTWTVPAYGNHPSEPGYTAGDFAGSRRTQGWRWNLDYVVDSHGNTMTLFYGKETGAYGREGDPAKRATYDRGGYLTRIEYSSRSDAAATAQAAARVVFDVADRCVTNCYTGTTPVAASWLDTPWDQYCAAAPCTTQLAPTFWTGKRLTAIRTQVYSGSGTTYTDVDQWTLRHTYLQAGGNEGKPMWLAGVTHSGRVSLADNGGVVTDPEIVFDPGADPLPNRVDGPADNRSSLFRSRIRAVTTESGAQIVPTYSPIQCTRSALPSSSSNTSRCFPQWYGPSGEEPTLDWFHSYRVDRVDVYDNTGGFTHQQTNYDYLDTPAWHYDDSELIPEKKRTWGQFRGYGRVRVRTGLESGTQSATEYLYFRGMDGDKQTSGVRDESVTDSQGVTLPDDDAYAGMLREQTTLLGAGGAWLTSTITTPGKQGPTAIGGTLTAWMTNTASTRTRTRLAGGGTRWVRTAYTYNADNLVTAVDDLGDESTAADDRCARTWYARNGANWMLATVKRTETVGVNCAATPTLPADLLSSTRTTYDLETNNWDTYLPVEGDAAKVEEISSWTGATPNWTLVSRATYDDAGRPLDFYDQLNRKSHTDYTPALAGPLTQTVSTDPLGHKITTTFRAAWGIPVKTVDDNGLTTETSYDGSGRLLGVWLPGRSKATFPTFPNTSYAYQVRNNAPSTVTTNSLMPNGSNTYATSITLFDGLLRERQTQAQAPGGGRVVADTVYDSRGLVDWTSIPYYDTTNTPPSTTVAGGPGDPPAPATTVNVYDGAGRNTNAIFMVGTGEKWRTTTAYNGERVDVVPPAGGTATGSVYDARSQLVELRQYKSLADTGSTDPAKYDKTSYRYTDRDELASVTDPAGNGWKYTYDQSGRQIRAEDPDKGITQSTYDNAGQLLTSTSQRGITLAYTYDAGGRKTSARDGSVTGAKRAEWIYDGVANGIGQLNKSIRYEGGQQYVSEVKGFDTAGRSTGTKITISSTEGTLCAAGGTTPCAFVVGVGYRANGQVANTARPAAADLPAETVAQGYNDVGAPTGLVSAAQIYLQDVTYSKLGQLTQQVLGAASSRVWLNFTYEDHTGRLISAKSIPELKPEIFNFAYKYDNAGNLIRIGDTPAGGSSDTQCFAYDYLQRLTEAWTPTSGDCNVARSTAALGGISPYWQSFEYTGAAGLAGSRTKETWHAAAGDTARSYTYPAQGQAAGSKPHAVTRVDTTGATTRTENYQYDADGNTTCRPSGTATNTCPTTNSQTLTWNNEGQLATVTGGTSYVYDADGNRLIRRDATGTTLYLPDGTEVRKTASAVTATRYYAGVAVRTASGITWIAADHHGTAEASVNGATLAATRRRTLPFGGDRGTPSGVWPTFMDKGFLGGTKEPTGLTHLGAREYDPKLGKFVSVDPIQDMNDPQQWNGYAYANNNPATFADPSGLIVDRDRPGCAVGNGGNCGGYVRPDPPTEKDQKVHGGGNSGGRGHTHESKYDGCYATCDGQQVLYKDVVLPADLGKEKQDRIIDRFYKKYHDLWCYSNGYCYQDVDEIMPTQFLLMLKAVCHEEGGCGENVERRTTFAVMVAVGAAEGMALGGEGSTGGRGSSGFESRAKTKAKSCNSFTPDTPVLMADGTNKPIRDIRVGDKVLATDPLTGTTKAKTVTALHDNVDQDFVDLEIVDDHGRRATIHTTQHHPVWSETDHAWVDAGELAIGTALRSLGKSVTSVAASYQFSGRAHMLNLTVADIHTYYVLAGDTPVLVHNCNPLTRTEKQKLGNLAESADSSAADMIRKRGGGASQINKLATEYKTMTLRDLAHLAVRGDREAEKAIKMVKQAGTQGKGGK